MKSKWAWLLPFSHKLSSIYVSEKVSEIKEKDNSGLSHSYKYISFNVGGEKKNPEAERGIKFKEHSPCQTVSTMSLKMIHVTGKLKIWDTPYVSLTTITNSLRHFSQLKPLDL